ncbi:MULTISPECIES: TfuA-like protein [Streptomyces]|uniref:TfuA-like protein n=1 Tax=Streptomyces TaxID=1883 RepID=UPI00131C19DB|nr:TfuA-like protein [Streptomyces virginiae]
MIFIGPSLRAGDSPAALGMMDVRPPIRRGDIDVLSPDVRTVAIVDGVFFSEDSVSAREILSALRRGVHILGSSSMGALRAAELAPYGMEGIGEVYRMYADGEITSDGEVALTFNPETGLATSEPLVNVRNMLRLAINYGVIDVDSANSLLQVARQIYFVDLSYEMVIRRAREIVPCEILERISSFIKEHRIASDLKRSDALQTIARLEEIASSGEFHV